MQTHYIWGVPESSAYPHFQILGTSSDANSVVSVEIAFDGGAWSLVATANAYADWTYDYTVPAPGTPEAVVAYQVRATDNSGAETLLDRQVVIDTSGPTAAIITPVATQVVNGTYRLSGTANDGYNLATVYYQVKSGAAPAFTPADPAGGGWVTATGTYAWEANYDTTADVDGAYGLYVVGVDSGGNFTNPAQQVAFSIDQTTDRPSINSSTLSAGGTFIDNLLPTSQQISGTVTDDDLVDSTKVQYKLTNDADDTIITDWAAVSGPPGLDSNLVSWSHTFALANGKFNVRIRGADTNFGGVYNGASFNWNEIGPIPFSVDTANPTTTITGPAQGSYLNAAFTISGTASDASGVKKVEINFAAEPGKDTVIYEDLTPASYVANYAWSYNYVLGADGIVNYQVIITDAFDKTFTTDQYVIVDTQAPTIDFSLPTNGETVNGSVLVMGTSSDSYQVAAVYLRIEADPTLPPLPGANPVAAGWTLLSGTWSWDYRFKSTDYADGAHTIYLMAKDNSGNLSTYNANGRSITIDQTLNPPVITIDTVNGSLLGAADSVTGTITDDDSVDVSTMEISFDGGTSWLAIQNKPATDGVSASFSHPVTAVAERVASYTVMVRASDVGETFVDTAQNIPAVLTTSGSITVDVDKSAPTGSITQVDNGKSVSATVQGVYISAYLKITGASADGVQVASVQARLGLSAYANVTNLGTNYDTWEWIQAGLSLIGDSVNLDIRITDIHSRTTDYSYQLLVDTTPPSASYLTGAGTKHGDLNIRGSSSDNILVSKVYLKHGTTLPAAPDASFTGWTLLGSTYSWNEVLDTRAINNTAVNSNYYISVVSVDGAGNNSTKQDLSIVINQSADQPVLTFTNVDIAAAQPSDNLLETNAKLIGTVEDDDGLGTIEIAFSADGTNFGAYAAVDLPNPVTGLSANWQDTVSGLGEGVHYAKIRVRDTEFVSSGTTPFNEIESARVDFVIDTAAPAAAFSQLDITDPISGLKVVGSSLPGTLINGDFVVKGSAGDNNGIKATDGVMVSTDGSFFSAATYAAGAWSYAIPVANDGSDDGNMTIYVTATDIFEKSTSISLPVVIDTGDPVIAPTQPTGIDLADPPNVNGNVTVRGTVTDASAINSFAATGGLLNTALTNTGTNLNWILDFDSYAYDDVTQAIDTGDTNENGVVDGGETWTNVWRMPIDITVYDAAGNRGLATYKVDVDPDSDKPIVFVNSPANNSSVAGAFVIQGSATDDDAVQKVTLQVDLDDDGVYQNTGYDLNGNSSALDDYENQSTAVDVTVSNGSWNVQLNQNGEFDKANMLARGVAGANGYIRLRAVPYDSGSKVGDAVEVRVYIDATAPIIKGEATGDPPTSLAALPTPSSGSTVNGTITVKASFQDDITLSAGSMQISLDGGVSYQTVAAAGGTVTGEGTVNSLKSYGISVDVDTTTTAVAGGNGILQIVLKITDATFKQSTTSIELNVDNTLPVTTWNYNNSLTYTGTPPNEIYTFSGNATDGGSYMLIGDATDSGTISGINKLHVYFVKDNQFQSPIDANDDQVPDFAPTATSNSTVADSTGTDQSIPFTENANYLIVIDSRLEQGQFDTVGGVGDQDGFEENLKSKGTFDEWFVYFDSKVFPDGPIDIYFVAYDEAGNKSYGKTNGQMSNFPPSIDSFDINATNYTASNEQIKASGTVALTMNVSDSTAIDTTTYKVSVVAKYAVNAGAIGAEDTGFTPFFYGTAGLADFTTRTGTDADLSIDTTDASYLSGNWYLMRTEVGDSHGNIVTKDFYLWVNNSDILAPDVLTLDAFDQDNVSGLNGHVEAAADSPDSDNQADLSGTVNITGTVYDDTSVASLTVEISYNSGGAWSTLGTATLGSATGDAINGYTYPWTYQWDTATITGVADTDIMIRAYGTDPQANSTAVGDRPSLTVDIVPYITNIDTGLDTGMRSFVKRSALGKYTVAVGTTITIDGYNLPGTAASSANVGGTALTPSSGSTTQIVVNLAATTTSGNLTVTTNTVASRNNTNDDSLSQNQEAVGYYPDRDDDRAISFWQVTSHTGWSGVDDAVMRPQLNASAQRVDMDWMYVSNSDSVYLNASKMTQSFAVKGGDYQYNNSGTRIWTFLNNSRWWGLTANETKYTHYGSVQWSRENGFVYAPDEDEGYNWNVPSTDRLGLGNLVYPADTTGVLSRYENIQIELNGTDADTDNFVAYYDSKSATKAIAFLSFETGTGVTGYGMNAWNSTINRDAYTPNKSPYSPTGNETSRATGIDNPKYNSDGTTQVRQDVVSGTSASNHFAMKYDSITGAVYLAWYDPNANALKFKYNTNPVGAPGTWTTWATSIDTNAGTHVAMAVDPTGGAVGGVHLAYLDIGTGYLTYTHLSHYVEGSATKRTVNVDALFSSGQYNSITVRDFDATAGTEYRPVITTFSSAFIGTEAALRIAYPVAAIGTLTDGASASTGDFSGSWEVVADPAATSPQALQTFVETTGTVDGQGNVVVGLNGSYLEEVEYLGF